MFEYEAMNEADVMSIAEMEAEMEGMSAFDVMSVDQYKVHSMHEYAAQHAAADLHDRGVCSCSDGWRLTPRDVWVSCPNCPTGTHPEEDTPVEQQYVMTGTGLRRHANGEDFDVVEIVVSTFDIVDFTCITFKGGRNGQEHRVSCADLDDAREQCKAFLAQGYKF